MGTDERIAFSLDENPFGAIGRWMANSRHSYARGEALLQIKLTIHLKLHRIAAQKQRS
jgi:hypothetical protein